MFGYTINSDSKQFLLVANIEFKHPETQIINGYVLSSAAIVWTDVGFIYIWFVDITGICKKKGIGYYISWHNIHH